MATLTTLVTFNGVDGSHPYAGVTFDSLGNLVGTTYQGGTGFGTVYEVTYLGSGTYANTPTTLVVFDGTNFASPYYGSLITDSSGNLLGTTLGGGFGFGTVYEVFHMGGGSYFSNPTALTVFTGPEGLDPEASLVVDASGNLFSAAYVGGAHSFGTVFELAYSRGSYASTATPLVSFDGTNGQQPTASLIIDASGDLFGTTFYGGTDGKGTVFELVNNGGGNYTPTVLVSFNGTNGQGTYSGVIADAAGDLFGTTYVGGANNLGTVYELVNNGGGSYSLTTLFDFDDTHGSTPYGNLLMDANGSLFGTTYYGGANGNGTVFEIAKTGGSYATTPTILASFDGANNSGSTAGLIADANGDLFGTTYFTTANGNGDGTVFELTGTGFQPACYVRGTKIATTDGEVEVEHLAVGDRVVTLSNQARAIKWIGRRSYAGRFLAGNRTVLPIRIMAGALADGVPARDLQVSPEHALYIDGCLIPARWLINGATITQVEAIEQVDYFHIELNTHDVLMAENAPAESYIDCDNRMMFANAAEFTALYPREESAAPRFCAPRLEANDAAMTEIRSALLQRARDLGHATTQDPDLCLVIDGTVVRPSSTDGLVYSFEVPSGTAAVQLASRTVVPTEIDAASSDTRVLGVAVDRIRLYDPDLSMDAWHGHALLHEGFHADEASHRWTNGLARVPDRWLRAFPGAVLMDVYLVQTSLSYRARDDSKEIAAAA